MALAARWFAQTVLVLAHLDEGVVSASVSAAPEALRSAGPAGQESE
jgi:hypothetical protein